jgi:hypothetical protein
LLKNARALSNDARGSIYLARPALKKHKELSDRGCSVFNVHRLKPVRHSQDSTTRFISALLGCKGITRTNGQPIILQCRRKVRRKFVPAPPCRKVGRILLCMRLRWTAPPRPWPLFPFSMVYVLNKSRMQFADVIAIIFCVGTKCEHTLSRR